MLRSVTSARLAALAAVLVLATGCGADPLDLPDLVGQPLDEAHRELEAMGFEEFEDLDAFEDRAVFMDANWVVVATSPAPGEPVTPGDVVTFEVGKRDEQRAIDEIPAGSPVAQEYAAAQARVAEEQAADAARQAAEEVEARQASMELVTGYVNELDPLIRLGNSVVAELDATATGIRTQAYGGTQSVVVLSAVEAVETFQAQLADREPPSGSRRAGTHEAMVDASQRFLDGARTLLSADGPARQSSLARYGEVRAEAGAAWNEALTALYRDSGVTPPLVP
ncbi:PASTA domain-containing protein [Geodermatophilus sp. CPCC 206100]|uniref:PASTA domain-containing protein n=1 Tax=Geodermatophilus sp. CPCC 206100 TaxID=3020054 RepID=UPI003B000427